jgi:predicted DNA-binding protein
MSRARSVKLLGEIDDRLSRYAELHGLTVNQVVAEAIESFLRERAEIRSRIAEARLTHSEYLRGQG